MIIAQEITFANDSKLEVVNYPHFLVRVKVKQIYAVLLQFNQNNGIELAEEQTKQSRTLHSYGIVYNIIIQKGHFHHCAIDAVCIPMYTARTFFCSWFLLLFHHKAYKNAQPAGYSVTGFYLFTWDWKSSNQPSLAKI